MTPTTPPTRFDTWVAGLDGDHIAALLLGVIVVLFVVGMVASIITRLMADDTPAPRLPVSSNRKAVR